MTNSSLNTVPRHDYLQRKVVLIFWRFSGTKIPTLWGSPYSSHSLPISWISVETDQHATYPALRIPPEKQPTLWTSPLPELYQASSWETTTHHWSRIVSVGTIEGFDVFKLKHISLNKGFSNLLVCPCYEKLVVMIGFLCQPSGKIDWSL